MLFNFPFELIVIIIIMLVLLIPLITLFIFIIKISSKKQQMRYEVQLNKRYAVSFKRLDMSFSHHFLLKPGTEYVIKYKLEVESGTIEMNIDNQFTLDTDGKVDDATSITFDKRRPFITFTGHNATNVKASAKVYKKRF